MVHYTHLDQGDFLAAAFKSIGLNWIGGLLALSAVIATFGVMLVFQLGQPRIWMSMSRDGLLPKKFSTIHPKFKTPSFSNWITFLLVGIPALVVDSELATDMNSIGTLFAFMLVCGGILVLQNNTTNGGKFKVPYINGKYVFPIILACILIGIGIYKPELYTDFFNLQDSNQSSLQVFWHKIPYFIFTLSVFIILFFTIKKNLSLIPVLGLLSCFYLITEMGVHNWMRFLIWLAIGLVIYFMYSIQKSKLNKK
jgi:amino acid transporter